MDLMDCRNCGGKELEEHDTGTWDMGPRTEKEEQTVTCEQMTGINDRPETAVNGSLSDGKRSYTVEEIQTILDIGRATAYRLIKRDCFRSVRIGGHIRISKKSFDAWLDGLP